MIFVDLSNDTYRAQMALTLLSHSIEKVSVCAVERFLRLDDLSIIRNN
jgi:hypothetical protein